MILEVNKETDYFEQAEENGMKDNVMLKNKINQVLKKKDIIDKDRTFNTTIY